MCYQAKWKREVVPDHKFDFINVKEFHSRSCLTRCRYLGVYLSVIIAVAVYVANIYTAVTMTVSNKWTNSLYTKCGDDCAVNISFTVGHWIFVGCIIFSFLLLGYESYKARKVIRSRDISYAYTNIMAHGYYSLRSYDHFCLFRKISSSTKKIDDFAFFIFFTFKGWKHLLLADAPRQVINGITLYSFGKINNWETSDLSTYYDGSWVTAVFLVTMIFTLVVFCISLILLIAAAILYLPLLCHIQGNLKEYVCHKIDKRIAELIKRKRMQRVAKNAALEKRIAGGRGGAIPQPTLPDVLIDDDDDDSSMRKPYGTGSIRRDPSTSSNLALSDKASFKSNWQPDLPQVVAEYNGFGAPPMPMYHAPQHQGYPPPQLQHQASFASTASYGTDFGSNTHLNQISHHYLAQADSYDMEGRASLSLYDAPMQQATDTYAQSTLPHHQIPQFHQQNSYNESMNNYSLTPTLLHPQQQTSYHQPQQQPSAASASSSSLSSSYLQPTQNTNDTEVSQDTSSRLVYDDAIEEDVPVYTPTAETSSSGYPVEKHIYRQ